MFSAKANGLHKTGGWLVCCYNNQENRFWNGITDTVESGCNNGQETDDVMV